MAEGWRDMPIDQLDRLVLFELTVLGTGAVKDNDWARRARDLAAAARERKLGLDIALRLEGEALFNQVFGDSRARAMLGQMCLRWLEQPYVAGLHLDVEAYEAADRGAVSAFREWLQVLDTERRKVGKGLSAFFPADDEFAPYDAASAKRFDYWVAQIYDAHSVDAKNTGPLITRARSNPVAIPRAVARLTKLRIPRQAILLSVPLYGWEWRAKSGGTGAPTTGRGQLLTYAETPARLMPENRKAAIDLARKHGVKRDAERTPYYAYAENGTWVQGWYEDMESLTHKLAAERGRGYGLAFFPLGYDQNAIVEPLLQWWRAAA